MRKSSFVRSWIHVIKMLRSQKTMFRCTMCLQPRGPPLLWMKEPFRQKWRLFNKLILNFKSISKNTRCLSLQTLQIQSIKVIRDKKKKSQKKKGQHQQTSRTYRMFGKVMTSHQELRHLNYLQGDYQLILMSCLLNNPLLLNILRRLSFMLVVFSLVTQTAQ